jgi:hypothetical protein
MDKGTSWSQVPAGSVRTDCVVNIDHIEHGKFAVLYAVDSSTGLLVVEMADSVSSEALAWQA